MNYRFYQILLAVFLMIFTFSQNGWTQKSVNKILNAADVPTTAKELQDFLPEGWKIMTETSGDLNGDKSADAVLTVAFEDSEPALIVAFKNADGSFTRAAVAPNALRCECGSMLGDGTPDAEISKGQIILKGWSGSREIRDITMRFRLEASTGKFLLIGDDFKMTDRLELATKIISSNYLTNQQIITEWIEDKKETRRQKKIKSQRVYLEDLDYQDYWEKFDRN